MFRPVLKKSINIKKNKKNLCGSVRTGVNEVDGLQGNQRMKVYTAPSTGDVTTTGFAYMSVLHRLFKKCQ